MSSFTLPRVIPNLHCFRKKSEDYSCIVTSFMGVSFQLSGAWPPHYVLSLYWNKACVFSLILPWNMWSVKSYAYAMTGVWIMLRVLWWTVVVWVYIWELIGRWKALTNLTGFIEPESDVPHYESIYISINDLPLKYVQRW